MMDRAFEARRYSAVSAEQTLHKLPPTYPHDMLSMIEDQIHSDKVPKLVVLDDDPTGTQTCHDINVLTVWDEETLTAEFESTKPGFFLLTNSRALAAREARTLIREVCTRIATAALACKTDFQVVLRGDSTLRGHIPTEPEAVEDILGRPDAWVIAPFFFQGGRLTIDDVHYVKEGEELVPAADTQFASDAMFGYKSSNLRDYVREKAGHRFSENSFMSITLEDLRTGGPQQVTSKLMSLPKDMVVIVNAAAEQDMHVFAAGVLDAEAQGKRYLYRTGAAFVSSRLGIRPIMPLSLQDLDLQESHAGGLIVAGSYVPKTTAQLKSLIDRRGDKLTTIEVDVEKLVKSGREAQQDMIDESVRGVDHLITQGKDVLIMTSRKLVSGHDGESSLHIGSVVAQTLVEVVEKLHARPKYVIAKGGITSSDMATKGLNIKRALIVGQAAAGVPLWRCDEPSSRHVGVPYVVFPGNVGSDTTLAEIVERWSGEKDSIQPTT